MVSRRCNPARRPARVLLGTLFAAFTIGESASSDAPVLERAIAADLNGSARDAIVFRLPNGSGAGVFLPDAQGRYVLKLQPALGPDVRSLTLGDADHDGMADLLVARANGDLMFWKGAGGGDFTSELLAPARALESEHDLHAAHRAASAEPPVLTGRQRERIVAAMAHDSIPTEISVAETSVAFASLDSDDVRSIAVVTSDGRLEVATGARILGVRLPAGFAPRLVVSGRFGAGAGRSFAVVGEGLRPRLVLVTPVAGATPSGAVLDWETSEVASPEAVFNVNVGQGGFSFAPPTVTIQVGDTVHWVWSAGGHTVTSGGSCTADNLFCSPSNLNCAAGANSASGATYDHVFPSVGSFPYFCRPHCSFGMTGTVIVQAPAAPGVVPDRTPAVPLRVSPAAGGMLALTWGASCSAGVTAYGIYEGTIPIAGAYDHKSSACPPGTATTATVTPTAGDHYYLVVPRTATAEGSYGKSSASVEIPPGSPVCVATQNLAACP